MEREEAIMQYIAARDKYRELCSKCAKDRITNREARFEAHKALIHAETDLIDICFDAIEEKLQIQLGELLDEVLNNPTVRHQVAELSLLLN